MKRKIFVPVVLVAALALGALFLPACASKTWSGGGTFSIVINAQPEKVFAYLENPKNEFEWSSGLKSLDCEGSGLGKTCRSKSELFGQTSETKSVVVDYVPNQRTVTTYVTSNGDLAWTGTAIYLPHPQGTKLILIGECYSYQLPSLLSKMPHAAVQSEIEKLWSDMLKNIKTAVEKQK